tara:strand:- start:671 stop:961 length:291 start_codon:yes stop_codon:yes gene_type:complete
MIKKIIILSSFVFLINCSAPGTAFLGPTFTGVKTGSVYQTSLSYGSGKAMKVLKSSLNEKDVNTLSKNDLEKEPILLSLKTLKVEISEPRIEEPLP